MKVFMKALVAACGLTLAACGPAAPAEGEEAPAAEEQGEVSQSAIWCPSGYHAHRIDWSATRMFTQWGQCPAAGALLHSGDEICQESTNQGYSCEGDWVVGAYHPTWGWGYIKIRSLDGH